MKTSASNKPFRSCESFRLQTDWKHFLSPVSLIFRLNTKQMVGDVPCKLTQIFPTKSHKNRSENSLVSSLTPRASLSPCGSQCRAAGQLLLTQWCPAVKPEEALQVASERTFDTSGGEPVTVLVPTQLATAAQHFHHSRTYLEISRTAVSPASLIVGKF